MPKTLKIDSAQTQSELFKIWSFSQLLVERKYPQFFSYINLIEQNYQWSTEELKNLVLELTRVTRQRLYELINLVYISISVQEFSCILGVSLEEAINIGLEQKWKLDDTKMYLLPLKKRKNSTKKKTNFNFFLMFFF